jgi:hypothetical protein
MTRNWHQLIREKMHEIEPGGRCAEDEDAGRLSPERYGVRKPVRTNKAFLSIRSVQQDERNRKGNREVLELGGYRDQYIARDLVTYLGTLCLPCGSVLPQAAYLAFFFRCSVPERS